VADDPTSTTASRSLHPSTGALEQLGLAFDQATIGMAMIGLDGRLLRVNQALCGLLGRPAEALGGSDVCALFDDPADLPRRAAAALPGSAAGSFTVERSCRRGDGHPVDLAIMVSPLHDASGQTIGYFGQIEDVTARNEALRALRASEARLRSVISNAPIVLSAYDRDGTCVFSEGRAFERLGITPSDRVGRSFVELRGDLPEAERDFARLLGGESFSAKRQVGEAIFDVHYRPLREHDDDAGPGTAGGEAGRVTGAISVAVDVTDLERTERERRALLRQLITAQETERRRLAADLHDDTVQSLSAARMHLSVVEAQLDRASQSQEGPAAASDLEVRELVKQVREDLEFAMTAARTSLFNLRPPLLDQAGLGQAVAQQLRKLAERSGCATELAWDFDERLDHDLEVLVFRMVQEALANVAKHAGARTVRLRGRRAGAALLVEVADDGAGFDLAGVHQREQAAVGGHIGLASMADRIETAGGSFTVDTAPGRGTTVRIRMPIPAPSQAPP
jgi:PAS domain S-box-containing protein